MAKRYYNKETKSWYYEGRSITMRTETGIFSGIPTEEQLEAWGYELHTDPEPSEEDKAEQARIRRMAEIKQELADTDYLDHKANDGEDMSEYDEKYGGDWRAYRRQLRVEYRELEGQEDKE